MNLCAWMFTNFNITKYVCPISKRNKSNFNKLSPLFWVWLKNENGTFKMRLMLSKLLYQCSFYFSAFRYPGTITAESQTLVLTNFTRHWSLSIPPENIRKSKIFLGYRKRSAIWKVFNKLFPKVKICSENPFGCVNYVWNWIVENVKVFIKKTYFYYNYLNNKWIITCSKSFKVNNRNTRKRCEIYSKLTIKTREQRHDVALVFLLLTLNIFHIFF